jgi:hypothetical protein
MSRDVLRQLFGVSLAFTVAALVALAVVDGHLKGPASPAGIVSFELCAYSDSCDSILQGWGPDARLMAALSLGLDYLFMLAYSAAICSGLLLVRARVPERLKGVTMLAAWLAWVAGIADALENYCLAQVLLGSDRQAYAWPAAAFATVKFLALGVALSWLMFIFVRYVALRSWRAS